jgi:AcrR family transcriptional regulator
MPKVSSEHMESRRNQILMAAYRCFGKKGFHKSTMRDICREAELSPGAVYNYFRSKDHLVEELAACGRANTKAFIEGIETPPDAPGALAEIMRVLLGTLDQEQFVPSTRVDVRMWGEAVHTPSIRDLFIRGHRSVCETLAGIVRRGQENGEIDGQVDPARLSRILVAILMGLQVQRAVDEDARFGDIAGEVRLLLRGTVRGGRDVG